MAIIRWLNESKLMTTVRGVIYYYRVGYESRANKMVREQNKEKRQKRKKRQKRVDKEICEQIKEGKWRGRDGR